MIIIKEKAYLRLIGKAPLITYGLFFKKHNKKRTKLHPKAHYKTKEFTA